ncbi:hypothetical protein [Microcystis phage Mel-JY01]
MNEYSKYNSVEIFNTLTHIYMEKCEIHGIRPKYVWDKNGYKILKDATFHFFVTEKFVEYESPEFQNHYSVLKNLIDFYLDELKTIPSIYIVPYEGMSKYLYRFVFKHIMKIPEFISKPILEFAIVYSKMFVPDDDVETRKIIENIVEKTILKI